MTQMTNDTTASQNIYSDDELIKQFPGFTNEFATVNGVTLHYVKGGTGAPLVCLPGWPQTWYSYHPIAMQLAKIYTVIIVDIRGMGSSEKTDGGYDKKTMAADIFELVQQLGFTKIHL